tara:strand:+ start:44230 stop:44481 length:252 start_codon:yes stop_codon:yes gene_type:complete
MLRNPSLIKEDVMNFSGVLASIGGLVKGLTGLALTLIPLALVVDILQPGTTNIVDGLSSLVTAFTGEGLVGLVMLILVMAIVD